MRRIASPRRGATLSTVTRASRLPSSTGTVFVTTTSSSIDDLIRSVAGPESTGWTPQARMRRAPSRSRAAHRLDHGPAGVDHVVDDASVPARDVADQVHEDRDVRAVPPLVDDGQTRVEALGDRPRPLHAARVGGDNDGVLQVLLPEVV